MLNLATDFLYSSVISCATYFWLEILEKRWNKFDFSELSCFTSSFGFKIMASLLSALLDFVRKLDWEELISLLSVSLNHVFQKFYVQTKIKHAAWRVCFQPLLFSLAWLFFMFLSAFSIYNVSGNMIHISTYLWALEIQAKTLKICELLLTMSSFAHKWWWEWAKNWKTIFRATYHNNNSSK